ncbi:MAG TPA: carboxypeptidase regulatory-like domain-containing protein [Terracidiphilus sp.]
MISLGLAVSWAAAPAEQICTRGVRVEGTITDPTGAVIPGAQVQASSGERTDADASGYYVLPCVVGIPAQITAQFPGFTSTTSMSNGPRGAKVRLDMRLPIDTVRTSVQVSADAPGVDTESASAAGDLNSADLTRLPDDPDDLLRELQALASAAGGDPSATTVVVDGFQNGSAMPPKSTIASIRVNPDLFSAEYENPLWHGGRIEITTKPGAESLHGALFFSGSAGAFNAADPFAFSATPASKKRYGFELTGPILRQRSGFSLALEMRDIDEFNVVDAVTLDSSSNQAPFHASVPAPQRLWIASARSDWQLKSNDRVTASFSANVNDLANQGVGGLVLPEAGYSSLASEYDLRFTNLQTPSANLLHQTRVGISWKSTQQTPSSTAPSLEVAGFFTGGGATSQNVLGREHDLEIDDDLTVTHGAHTFKFGGEAIGNFVSDLDPNTFNGAFVFGGGSAPQLDAGNNPTGETTTISGLEQYRRTLLSLPGGTPTAYQLTSGTPLISLSHWDLGLYAQDTVKLNPRLMVDAGLRYQMWTTPNSFIEFGPRISISWAPDRKQTWVIHVRAGLFTGSQDLSTPVDVLRLNGTRQREVYVYSPSYTDPLGLTPGSIQVSTVNRFAPGYGQTPTFQTLIAVEHEFPHHWHAQVNINYGASWRSFRVVNVNAPLVSPEIGTAPGPTAALLAPRPISPNLNINQYQMYGHSRGTYDWVTLDQTSLKRFTLHLYYAYLSFKEDEQTPQSSYREQGEAGRPWWMTRGGPTVEGSATLPFKVELDSQFSTRPGRPYNITTGTDANGDGSFNDRAAFAAAPGPGVYSTPFGLLTSNTINGNVPYNLGTMPRTVDLDANLSRVIALNPRDKDHLRTITINARSANLLNHTNVTTVNSVVSSSALGTPIAAETARRLELGVRFSF